MVVAKKHLTNLALLLATLLLLGGIDRLLLAGLGRPLWIADDELHYRHRPSTVGTWYTFDDQPIYINAHGHHDDEFPEAKPPGELRILSLGDSVTMGHGVTRDKTYANQLERRLEADSALAYRSYQVINAGVQGYAVFQELEVLRRSLRFRPDLVTVGFCLNDATEPFVVNRRYGGTGLDYHRVAQTSRRWLDYVYNETGYGRLAQEIRLRLGDVRQARLRAEYDVGRMIRERETPLVQQRWGVVLDDLATLYAVAAEHDVPVLLLVFPYTFQLGDAESQWPQQVLNAHAAEHGIPIIDFTPVFERLVARGEGAVEDYFLDEDHFTVRGHGVVAREIHARLPDLLSEQDSSAD